MSAVGDGVVGETRVGGVVRIDPAAVVVLGGERATAAELARWVRRMRAMDVVGWAPGASWYDVAAWSIAVSGLAGIVWLVRR